jgi:hypothetical protein
MHERSARHHSPVANGRMNAPGPEEVPFTGPASPRQLAALQRTAGNRAVAAAFSRPRPAVPVVQRWAFVGGTLVPAGAPGLNPAMQAFTTDQVVRDYTDQAEFRAHADGRTDYLGNLPGPSAGTWVRFSPTGTNLIGENHTHVTLEHVVRAVGTTNFVYEPFAVDRLPAGSRMRLAYEAENAQRFADFGVAGARKKRQFGMESLFPKMGFAVGLVIPYLTVGADLTGLQPGQYVGQPAQRYLKIAWGHAGDLAAKEARRLLPPQPPAEVRALIQEYNASRATLDPFITGLPVNGYLGTALGTPAAQALVPALRRFCEAFVEAMLLRSGTDTGLTRAERRTLRGMPRGTAGEREALFADWRNLHFAHTAAAAARRGVRYAGMGALHLDYLEQRGLPPRSHAFDLRGPDLTRFENLTAMRRTAALAQPPVQPPAPVQVP